MSLAPTVQNQTQPDFDTKHPLYEQFAGLRKMARDFYDGQYAVRAAKREYLPATENETDAAYNRRLKRAVFDNWTALVVESRQALIWRKAPAREKFPPGFEKSYFSNVDGCNTGVDSFFKTATDFAAADGISFVLIDKPRMPEAMKKELTNPETGEMAQPSEEREEQMGLRPYMTLLPGSFVIDWDFGPDRKLAWAVIAEKHFVRTKPGFPARLIERRKIWDRQTWEYYEKSEKATKDGPEWVLIGGNKNDLGEVPLVPFYGIKIADMVGLPVTKDILAHNLSIYNKFSDRDYSEYLTNNPKMVIVAAENPGQCSVNNESGLFLKSVPQLNANATYLEPSGVGVEASRASERDLIRRIFEIALRQAKRDTAQVQAEESLKAETQIFKSSLAAVAALNAVSEKESWRIFAKWQRKEFAGEVTYQTDFDDSMITEGMINAFSGMVDKAQLSNQTQLEILEKGEAINLSGWTAKIEQARIQEEMAQRGMIGFNNQQSPPAEDEPAPEDDDAENPGSNPPNAAENS